MMMFHDIRLPSFIEYCAYGGPEYTSSVVTTISGREVRHLDCHQSKQKYILQNCRLSRDQFDLLNQFFRARMGKLYSFRFRDITDYQVLKQSISKIENNFLLYKIYDDPILPYKRFITKPLVGTVRLYTSNIVNSFASADGQEERSTTGLGCITSDKIINPKDADYIIIPCEVDYNTGIINIEDQYLSYGSLFIDFIFDVHVRFNNDSLTYHYCEDGSIELQNLELIEVID